jgi:hypothetical protein
MKKINDWPGDGLDKAVQDRAGAGSESSGDEPSSTNGTDDRGSESKSGSDIDLTRTETRAVRRSKALVYLVLLFATAAVGTVTYTLTYNEETATFRQSVRPVSCTCCVSRIPECS